MIRPLRRRDAGHWESRDGRFTFLRHWSDPHPQRWFTYEGDSPDPASFEGDLSLREAVRFAESLSDAE